MKRTLRILSVLCMLLTGTNMSFAQLSDGSIAPDFTATDINGTTYHLYDYLDQGKTVVIDISATWCGPCWAYHNSGALEDLYTTYGPNGTNEMMVFYIEGDGATTLADLYGTGTNTQGNWVAGTPYPIIDNSGIANSYAIRYFPTIYMICPDRVVREVGQLTTAALYTAREECSVATQANDAGITHSMTALNGTPASCSGVTIRYRLCNYGTAPLTSATIELSDGTNVLQTNNWTGSLQTYESTSLSFTGVAGTPGYNNVTVTVSNPNGQTDGNALNNSGSQSYIIYSGVGGPAVTEDYSSTTFPPANWYYINGGNQSAGWSRSTAGYTSSGCAKMDFVNSPSGDADALILPPLDLSTYDNAVMTFYVAAATYGTSNDNIKIKVSTNCGTTWSPIWNKTGASLATVGSVSSAFTPSSANQWRSETVNLTQYTGVNRTNVMIKFEALSAQGNNAYIDDINMTLTTGLKTVTQALAFDLYPNPATQRAQIDFNLEKAGDVTMQVVDKMGKLVYTYSEPSMNPGEHTFELNTSDFAKGIYMVNIKSATGSSQKKLVVE
ncbi:MAG: T9SS type A sorting domain-containing protein [Bacteroidetes bacterium]|nr:T9SS type A sorting domain-containing protein [Bacteroidota bacterium]MBL0138547.1 T9SS type A sorting domain-containing protein [Bacteroidota bacterium]